VYRLAKPNQKRETAARWFGECREAAELFEDMEDFEPACRLFLNALNRFCS
jgi:hypothetical protein